MLYNISKVSFLCRNPLKKVHTVTQSNHKRLGTIYQHNCKLSTTMHGILSFVYVSRLDVPRKLFEFSPSRIAKTALVFL